MSRRSLVKVGATGSIARWVSDAIAADPLHYGDHRYLVYEYSENLSDPPTLISGGTIFPRPEWYEGKRNRVLVDLHSYYHHVAKLVSL